MFNREVFLKPLISELETVSKDKVWVNFETDYSGFLGIAPWTADPDNKEKNFLW